MKIPYEKLILSAAVAYVYDHGGDDGNEETNHRHIVHHRSRYMPVKHPSYQVLDIGGLLRPFSQPFQHPPMPFGKRAEPDPVNKAQPEPRTRRQHLYYQACLAGGPPDPAEQVEDHDGHVKDQEEIIGDPKYPHIEIEIKKYRIFP